MNLVIRNIGKKSGIILLIASFIIVLSNFVINSAFYNPYRDFNTTSSTFNILNQLLSPSITESYLDQDTSDYFLRFSHYSQGFRLLKFSYSRSPYEPQNTGKINYMFGNATIENYTDRLDLGDLTCQQRLFMDNSFIEQQDERLSVSDNQSYLVWMKFDTPIDRTIFEDKYAWLLDNNISRSKQCGILWIPVKTSDKPEDICIGVAGNLSFHYLNSYNIFSGHDFYNMDLFGRELVFNEAIKFLTEHPKESNMFINTGLWTNAETVALFDDVLQTGSTGIFPVAVFYPV